MIARLLLAAILVVVAILKLSTGSTGVVLQVVALSEIFLALLLCFRQTARMAGWVALSAFLGAGAARAIRVLVKGSSASCGCLGGLEAVPGLELVLTGIVIALALRIVQRSVESGQSSDDTVASSDRQAPALSGPGGE